MHTSLATIPHRHFLPIRRIFAHQVLQGELLVFMTLFLIFIGTFTISMLTIFPDHHARGKASTRPGSKNS